MVDFKEIVVSVILQEVLNRAFSFVLEKREEKVSQGEFLERIQKSLNKMELALERSRKLPITDISLLRRRKKIEAAYTLGRRLLTTYEQPQKLKNQPVTRYSVDEFITGHATKFSFLPLLGFSKERLLSSSDVREFERHADSAAKFVGDVVSGCSLWHLTVRCPLVRHLLEGKSLCCEIVKNRSQSISLGLRPFIMEGRGVAVRVQYEYKDFRKLEECIELDLSLRISEDTDIIGTIIKCMQQLTSLFKLAAKTAIGELKLLPDLQDSFYKYVHPSSFVNDEDVRLTELFRRDPICCNENSYGTLANKSSMEIPEPLIWVRISCHILAPRNSLRNAPLLVKGFLAPHKYEPRLEFLRSFKMETPIICIKYGDKLGVKTGSVQQLGEIARSVAVDYLVQKPEPTACDLYYWFPPHDELARSDAVDYLVQEPEPTACDLYWFSPHGFAFLGLSLATPRRSRKVSKRKR